MSDPMKNTDIEDVLSSIRRLVSDGESAPVPTFFRGGTLVLTEALRVDDAPESGPSPLEAEAPEVVDDAPAANGVQHETGAEEEEGDSLPAAAAAEVGAGDAQETAESMETAAPVGSGWWPRLGEAARAAERDDAPEHDAPASAWEQISLEERVAELEAAVAGCDEEWEPDGSEITQHALSFEELETGAATLAGAAEAAFPAEDDGGVDVEAQAKPEMAAEAETVPEPDAEPDAEPEAEPEAAAPGADPEPQAGTAADGEDEAWAIAADTDGAWPDPAPQASPGLHPEPEPADDSGFEQAAADLDEDVLRELVSDIVRQELQGALGERITRNVRKLVRREINRALASRDFD